MATGKLGQQVLPGLVAVPEPERVTPSCRGSGLCPLPEEGEQVDVSEVSNTPLGSGLARCTGSFTAHLPFALKHPDVSSQF